ncbi:MAG: hypothetical protein HYT22_03810 [Candidatus Niyogibacteria bacterium]|nr:hypothetical protein [Candidatus Niyogibacteria bacterium]
MEKLIAAEFETLGIKVLVRRMDNGEIRSSFMKEGVGYILTEMPKGICGWQNSHFHKSVRETYVVQQGWIASAELMPDGAMKMTVHRANSVFTTHPNKPHNIYMSAGAVIHTVKHGDASAELSTGKADWHASPELDNLTKHLSEKDIFWRTDGLEEVPDWAKSV